LASQPGTIYDRLELLYRESGARSQHAWAQARGLSQSVVSKWFRRATVPDLPALLKVVQHDGVNLHWLVLGEGPRGVPSAKGDPGYREGMRMRMVVARLRDLAHEAEVSIPTSATDVPVERRLGERRAKAHGRR